MRKNFITFLLTVAVCALVCGCDIAPEKQGTLEAATASWQGNTEATPLAYVATEPEYDSDVNYMGLMVQYAARGDTDALDAAIAARNAKIIDQGLDCEELTLESFLDNYEHYAGFSLDVDYSAQMKQCCLSGDIEAGREAASKRNLKLKALGELDNAEIIFDDGYDIARIIGMRSAEINFDDLYELSKIITAEAGSSWLSTEWKMMIGEVVLNRVASVEFPNTIYEVIHQKGQYANANTSYFSNLQPFEDCVTAAIRLLNGERLINDESVVFQSGKRQGGGTYLELYDSYYGYTYLCYSSYPELYES